MVMHLQSNGENSKKWAGWRSYVMSLNKQSPYWRELSTLHQHQNVSTQFDDVKTNFLNWRLGPTNVGISDRTCEGKCFLKPVDPWYVRPKSKFLQLAKQAVWQKKKFQTKLILTYSLPIECHFNNYLAKQSFELTEFSRWLSNLSWTAVTNHVPSAGFKIWNVINNPLQMSCFVPKLEL